MGIVVVVVGAVLLLAIVVDVDSSTDVSPVRRNGKVRAVNPFEHRKLD